MALIDDLIARKAAYETALTNALTAQSYGIAGRSKTNASIDSLQKEINVLEARIARLGGTGATVVQAEFQPSTSGGSTANTTDEDED